MEEIITLDGKQFKLMSDRPLTALERQQTISDIRRQSGCSSCNKTQSLGNGIQTLAASCVDIAVMASDIAVADVTIGGLTACTPGTPGTCPSITCTDLNCTSIAEDIVVRFTNSGDVDGTITPTLTVKGVPAVDSAGVTVVPTPPTVTVSVGGALASVTFAAVALARGHNTVCADFS